MCSALFKASFIWVFDEFPRSSPSVPALCTGGEQEWPHSHGGTCRPLHREESQVQKLGGKNHRSGRSVFTKLNVQCLETACQPTETFIFRPDRYCSPIILCHTRMYVYDHIHTYINIYMLYIIYASFYTKINYCCKKKTNWFLPICELKS